MKPDRIDITKLQVILHKMQCYSGEPDGVFGPLTKKAIEVVLPGTSNQPPVQLIARAIQDLANENLTVKFKRDGIYGPITEDLLESLYFNLALGISGPIIERAVQIDNQPKIWPVYKSEEFYDLFGMPGENIVHLKSPAPLVYAFDHSIKIETIQCNRAVKDSVEEGYTLAYEHYGDELWSLLNLDKYGGCYNFRQMKGGDDLSTHAWAISIDTDPENNRFKWGKDKAHFAARDYEKWFEIWYALGWINLGLELGFDYMHNQACRLR